MNIENILKRYKIPYIVNVKAFNVQCPVCPKDDPDNGLRCGLFKDNSGFNCFRCKKTGSLDFILDKLTNGIYEKELENDNITDTIKKVFNPETEIQESVKSYSVTLPDSVPVTKELCSKWYILRSFLKKRNISIETCQQYKVRFSIGGKYPLRLIIPIYDNDKLICWQGKDVTDTVKPKYVFPSHAPIANYFYFPTGFQKKNRIIYIVEGIFDTWRMGNIAIASFSKKLSKEQQLKLLKRNFSKKIVFAWDSDAFRESIEAANDLSSLRDGVGIIRLPKGQDPDSMGRDEVLKLKIKWM